MCEEIKRHIPVLLGDELRGFARPEQSGTSTSKKEDPLSVRAWKHEGDVWVLVVNSSDKPLDAQLSLSRECGSAAAAFGPAPRLVDGGRKLSLSLAPLEPALVRLH